MAILHGNFHGALYLNPLGFLIFVIMLVTPFWITVDMLLKRSTFFHFYQRIEILLKRKWITIPAVLLVLINWVWNIKKNL
jgi:hypothetical protein